MDKRKLIGTIIGVLMFGMLIVGATYAWLSFNATVVNATYNGTTVNYWVDYEGDATGLSDVPILSSTATPSNTNKVVVKAKRPSGSIANNITIKLTTTSSNTLTTSGAVKYVICKGACTTNFDSAVGKWSDSGMAIDEAETLNIYVDSLGETEQQYYIYFWIDASMILNTHLGQQYSGYIHASSDQDRTNYG